MKLLRDILFTAALLVVALLTLVTPAQAESQNATVIGQFNGTNGSTPVSRLIQLPNGNFLGVTLPPYQYPKSAGTIFQLTAAGVLQAVYRFAADGSQGFSFAGYHESGIMQASDGKIYGVMTATTTGPGLLYRFTLPTGPFEVIHAFSSTDQSNGIEPVGTLVQALDGNLYGVCNGGGNSDGFGDSFGTIFRVGLDGSFSTVYLFSNTGPVGSQPDYGLVLHPNGLLYGTVSQGVGSLYSFDPSSLTAKAVFQDVSPTYSPLVVGVDGGLYLAGTTSGCAECAGQIVRYGTDGSGPTAEFTFANSAISGLTGSLVQLGDGTFVGSAYTSLDSAQQMFHADPTSQTFIAYNLPRTAETGNFSAFVGNVIQGAAGGVLGASPVLNARPLFGGVEGLFASLPKPNPAVSGLYPPKVAPGGTFSILGDYFVGATSVTMNGQSLSFTVKASGAISVIAPQSPTTGSIVISTPGGTVTSSQVLIVQ